VILYKIDRPGSFLKKGEKVSSIRAFLKRVPNGQLEELRGASLNEIVRRG